MAVIGYIRVSSNKQTVEHQRHEIQQFVEHNNINVDKWVEETISSRKPLNKRKLGPLLDELQEGDIIIAAEISRLGRSLLEVMRILENCLNKNWLSILLIHNILYPIFHNYLLFFYKYHYIYFQNYSV